MNKGLRKAAFGAAVVFCAAGALAVLFTGCAGAPKPTASASVPSGANVGVSPTKAVVRDWSNRTLGIPSTPPWLQALALGNSGPVKEAFGINAGSRVKFSLAQNRNRENARVQAGLLFAAKTATELKQYVVTGAGSVLDDGQLDIVEEIATATKITITGNSPVADFWQLVEVEDLTTHQKTQEYLYYIVYSMEESTWKALVRKYTNDIIGQLPDRPVQAKVAGAFNDIDAAASRETAMSEAQFKAQVAAQEQQARNDQQLKLAQINQQTAANTQAQQTARTEAEANASAQRAALRSGDPVKVAAVSTTAADVDWISALGTAAAVIF